MGNLQSNDLVAGQVAAADAIMDDFTPEDLRKAMEEAVVPQAGILTLFAGFDPSLTKLNS